MREFIGACIASFGIGLLSVSLSIPASIWLIRNGDKHGWWCPAVIAFALSLIAVGVSIHE